MATVIRRGDDELFDIPLINPQTGQPRNLAGHAVWVTAKRSPDDPDEEAIYQHYIHVGLDGQVIAAKGMSIKDDDPALGVVVEHLTAAESAQLTPETVQYDVQVMLPNGLIKTSILGEDETIVPDWTRAIEAPGGA